MPTPRTRSYDLTWNHACVRPPYTTVRHASSYHAAQPYDLPSAPQITYSALSTHNSRSAFSPSPRHAGGRARAAPRARARVTNEAGYERATPSRLTIANTPRHTSAAPPRPRPAASLLWYVPNPRPTPPSTSLRRTCMHVPCTWCTASSRRAPHRLRDLCVHATP
jgi:hypothetical protein